MSEKKPRVKINLKADFEQKAKSKGLKHSSFLLSINPNINISDPNSTQAKQLALKLKSVADFLLKKSVIKQILRFDNIEGQPEKNLQEHLNLIESIDDDRSGSIEYGATSHRLHMHLYFTINHRTFIKLDRDKIAKIASDLIGVPEKQLNISFNVQSPNKFVNYVNKYSKINEENNN